MAFPPSVRPEMVPRELTGKRAIVAIVGAVVGREKASQNQAGESLIS
jgi:hypothetical protein